jgi:type II secretory pathway pseudopilin PulG
MSKNQKGFTPVEGLLVLVIVGILAGTGFYVWHSTKKTNEILNSTEKTSETLNKSKIPKDSNNKAQTPNVSTKSAPSKTSGTQATNTPSQPNITTISLSYNAPNLKWGSSPKVPKGGYILYWARIGCLAKFGCIADYSELVVKGFHETLESSTTTHNLGDNNSGVAAMVCENINGSCGIKSNIINIP